MGTHINHGQPLEIVLWGTPIPTPRWFDTSPETSRRARLMFWAFRHNLIEVRFLPYDHQRRNPRAWR